MFQKLADVFGVVQRDAHHIDTAFFLRFIPRRHFRHFFAAGAAPCRPKVDDAHGRFEGFLRLRGVAVPALQVGGGRVLRTQGGSGGAGNGANGSSFSEIYKFFPGPSIRANGGFAGENGKGGAGATTGGLRNMDSNASIVFATNDENDVFYEDVAGKSGEDATLDGNSLGNNGGTGGGSVVGRAFVDNRQFTHKYLHQGAIVHSSTGGGGYGGGGSGSVTPAGAYASDQRWVKYDRGGWAPVGAAAVSGGAGAGGSYLTHDDALLEGQILPDLVTRPATALSRINAVAELSWCRLPNSDDPKKENSDNKDNKDNKDQQTDKQKDPYDGETAEQRKKREEMQRRLEKGDQDGRKEQDRKRGTGGNGAW